MVLLDAFERFVKVHPVAVIARALMMPPFTWRTTHAALAPAFSVLDDNIYINIYGASLGSTEVVRIFAGTAARSAPIALLIVLESMVTPGAHVST
jgi:hypothetical protein